jgi:hypothetical protein
MLKRLRHSNGFRYIMLVIGWFLLIASPLAGPIPGPGPLLIMPIGLALILKNSLWAKRRYSRIAKANPAYGRWLDWALRRSKAKHRPPVPDIKADIVHLFRRDDVGQKLP